MKQVNYNTIQLVNVMYVLNEKKIDFKDFWNIFLDLDEPVEKKPPKIEEKPVKVMEKTPPKRDMDYW